MKTLSTLFLFTLLCFPEFVFTQDVNIKWGKVTKDELELTQCSFDTAASAVILLDVGRIYFNSGVATIEYHRRIKILKPDGIEYANVVLPYVHQNGRENIRDVKAHTVNATADGKPELISVENNQRFEEKLDEYWARVNFAFPAVRPGSIIEYKYTFHTDYIFFLKPWFFQHELPTLHSELSVEVPSYLSYNIVKFGARLKQLPANRLENKWILNNLPGYKSEKYVFHPEDYAEQIHFQLLSYEKAKNSISGGYETVNVLESWDKLGESVLEDCKFYLNRRKSLEDLLVGMIDPADNQKDKVRKIFRYVQQHYTWNNYWSVRPSQAFNRIESEKTGNSAEINLLLTGLLRQAGLTADPMLVSTRQHGKVVRSFPLLSQFNHLICRVIADGEPILLDAALNDGLQPYFLLPKEDLNWNGFLLRKDSFEWANVEPWDGSKHITVLNLDLENKTGELKLRYEGYAAGDQRRVFVRQNNHYQSFTSPPEIGAQLVKLENPESAGQKQYEEPLELTYRFPLDLTDESFFYFSPLSWSNFAEVPFKSPDRFFPIEFDYPFFDNLMITIKLPESYHLDSKPDNKSIALRFEQDEGRFIYSINEINGQVIITSRTNLKQTIFVPEAYPFVKSFFEQINAKLSEVIVIKKR